MCVGWAVVTRNEATDGEVSQTAQVRDRQKDRRKAIPRVLGPNSLLEGLWDHSLVTGSEGPWGSQHPTRLSAADKLPLLQVAF